MSLFEHVPTQFDLSAFKCMSIFVLCLLLNVCLISSNFVYGLNLSDDKRCYWHIHSKDYIHQLFMQTISYVFYDIFIFKQKTDL